MPKLFHAIAALSVLLGASVGANAADMRMPVKAPPPPPPFSWTGFYIGGNLGGAWAHRDWTDNFGLDFGGGNSNGVFVAGGQVGGNYQFNNFVIGVEGTFDWSANNNNNSNGIAVPALGGNVVRVTSNDTWLSTLAARFGVAWTVYCSMARPAAAGSATSGFTVTNVTTGASITGSTATQQAGGWWAVASNGLLRTTGR